MNVKKASSPYTIVRERDQSSAITLRRLFNLWAIFCCFTFAAGQSSALLSSTAKKSAFLDSTSGVSSAISAYSSHSVPINNPSENGKAICITFLYSAVIVWFYIKSLFLR